MQKKDIKIDTDSAEQRRTASRKPVTIREVAKAAGVSLMTVSNVVNGRFGSMRADTRERVEQAIADLQYHPRSLARALRLNREFAIGLLIVDPTSSFLADPFTSHAVAGLSNYLGQFNYGCLVHGVRPEDFEESIFLRDSRTAALCGFLCGDQETRRNYLERLQTLRKPIVAIEDTNSSISADVAIVGQDDFGAAAAMTKLLLARGCVNFHAITPETQWPSVNQRLEGMRCAIKEAGSDANLECTRCDETSFILTEAALATLAPRLCANSCLIATTDRLAAVLSRALRLHNPVFMEGTLYACFGVSEMSRDLSLFDVIAQSDPHSVGAAAGRILLDRIEMGYFEEHEKKVPIVLHQR